MENSGESSQATRNVLARAVRASAKSTKRAIRHLDEFKKEELIWRKQTDLDQRGVEWGQTGQGPPNNIGQTKQQPAQTTALPDHYRLKHQDRAEKTQI